jgi:hypothetical protein
MTPLHRVCPRCWKQKRTPTSRALPTDQWFLCGTCWKVWRVKARAA